VGLLRVVFFNCTALTSLHAWITLGIGSSIVALAPFDIAFAFATAGSATARVAALTALGLVGLVCAGRVGLGVSSVGLRRTLCTPLAVGAATALGIVVIDCFVFRRVLPADYVELFRNTRLGPRLLYFMLRAFTENVIYRLFLMSLLVSLLGSVWRRSDGEPANGAYWTAMTLAQIANITINVVALMPAPITPVELAYDGVRYVVPGVIWGYLYWRHGFVTAEIASVGAHPFLQPALGYLLA
jgi:hypothetical protein